MKGKSGFKVVFDGNGFRGRSRYTTAKGAADYLARECARKICKHYTDDDHADAKEFAKLKRIPRKEAKASRNLRERKLVELRERHIKEFSRIYDRAYPRFYKICVARGLTKDKA